MKDYDWLKALVLRQMINVWFILTLILQKQMAKCFGAMSTQVYWMEAI